MEEENEWKEWSYGCKAASGQFLDGPGWVRKLTLTADGSNSADVSFYDGHNANGTHKTTLRTVANRSQDVDYSVPFRVEQGLYATLSTNIECVSVQYKKDKL